MTVLCYGSRTRQRGIDEISFRLIHDLVTSQPGETQTLCDNVVFDVPRSGITRPGTALFFRVELGTRGESISIKAFHRLKTLAKYELRYPLNRASFNSIEIIDEQVDVNNYLLRREQSTFSDMSVVTDRKKHFILCDGKQLTYTFQKRWIYPFVRDNDSGWYLGNTFYEIRVEGDFTANELVGIARTNLPDAYKGADTNPFVCVHRCCE